MQDFTQWICNIKSQLNVKKQQERLRAYHKERESVCRVKGYVFWNDEQICSLSKDYDNNNAIKNIIKEQSIASKRAKRLEISYDKVKTRWTNTVKTKCQMDNSIKRNPSDKAIKELFTLLGI